MSIDQWFTLPAHGFPQSQKQVELFSAIRSLTLFHTERCEAYRKILSGYWPDWAAATELHQLPYLPVSLFKTHDLRSVERNDVRMTLSSSGTTGQAVSKIAIDAATSNLQAKGLASSLAHVLGKKRLPMLIIDTEAIFRNPSMMSARGAGVLGMMRFGYDHAFALTPDLQPDLPAVEAFLEKHGAGRFAIFGFTFMVWTYLQNFFGSRGLNLENGILIHSGGWKKLQDQAIDNDSFREALGRSFGLHYIHNFYGMVEQLGSIFLEGPSNLLYPPSFSDVIIRCPETWMPLPQGEPGVIQVISLLPHSYPGHSLLTEDFGVIERVDPEENGWMGNGLRVLGRVPKAELRGCSDIIAQSGQFT